MKRYMLMFMALAGLAACQPKDQETTNETRMKVTYPTTDTIAHQDDYFGKTVSDPYRWLEDDRSEATGAWVKAQNEVTFGYLEKIPFREPIRKRLEELWNYEKYSAPFQEGDYTYFYKNDGLQNQFVLYRQKAGGDPEVFLDPNKFSADGTTSLSGIEFSEDGSLAAYQISEGGSDWRKVIVLDAASKQIMGDTLVDLKFTGLAWKGKEGFYYSSYDKPKGASELSAKTQYHKLYFHKLGTPQSQDKLVFGGEKTPRRYIGGGVTEDNHWLVISAAVSTTGNELYIQDLTKANAPIVPVVGNFDNDHYVVHSEGSTLYIYTNWQAPNGRLVKVDASQPQQANWVDVIAEREEPLTVSTGGGYFFAQYLKDALSVVEQVDLNGKVIRKIELPGQGTAGGFSGKWKEKTLYYSFTNYVYPPTIYSYEVGSGKSTLYKESKVKFDPAAYESKQVFYTSKDGTRVPMMITYKKGLKMDGKNPTMLYGYGGFNISLTPSFSTSNIVWMENGGVYAVPNLRGGGEYGEKWHLAGTKMQKQNVFDDFIAAAEYLIKEGYTSSEYLAISGGSNGGLLVGAVMTQRPDLMKVALPAVGVLDMLRYHQFTAGAGWAYDYGTADESPEMFNYLLGYSPYQNIKPGTAYPATLVTTGDHDDRVVPAHSFKFAAALQAAQTGDNPTLIRIETKAGHGAGKPTAMIIEEQADKWAFTFYNMNVPVKYLAN
ncbi:MAG: S9 family peptidase [Lewinellaceae bacterium]|nr:S9 family peptidase [Lewinellaceae bacterium]